jgi:hypothetical protein
MYHKYKVSDMRDTICGKNTELLNELLQKQLKTVPGDKKFRYNDLKRLCKYITSSIFDDDVCSLWKGYVTNTNNVSKGIYINFYFKGKKTALHRLLYINFVGPLTDDEYLKFSCEHKGKCCNVTHLKKFSYVKKEKPKEVAKKRVINPDLTKAISFSLSFD